jgi:dihydrodipicolinate synthase/N-acetylneuraminate lyase
MVTITSCPADPAMPIDHGFPADRATLTKLLFPAGVPPLWAPTLVFYDEAGRIDRDRQLAHLAFMASHVRGILVPGSTGDAWEMDDAEALAALEVVIPFAVQEGLDLLVGVLRPTPEATRALLDKVLDHLRGRAGTQSIAEAFAAARVRGVTIAAPTSTTPLPQAAIGVALEPLFGLGLPTALYQLPQVTGNTMMPELVAGLAERFPNLLLFKDSGGRDEVALSGRMPAGVVLLRGAEGDYARWSKARGGPYDGFLLSSANAFPAQLAAVLKDLRQGRVAEAERCSAAVSAAVADAFAAVAEVRVGNAFTNANKALAHVMAYGRDALGASPPRLYAGGHLPRPVLETVAAALEHHALLPERGYLQERARG